MKVEKVEDLVEVWCRTWDELGRRGIEDPQVRVLATNSVVSNFLKEMRTKEISERIAREEEEPATERQLELLKKLGLNPDVFREIGLKKKQASKLIDIELGKKGKSKNEKK